MNAKRKIEIFSAGCPACEETISRIQDLTCPSCEVVVLDMKDAGIAQRAKDLGAPCPPSPSTVSSPIAAQGADRMKSFFRQRGWDNPCRSWL